MDFLVQYIYVFYIAPIVAIFLYSLFRNGIQGETKDDGTTVEEASPIVRIIVLCVGIFGIPFLLYLMFGGK